MDINYFVNPALKYVRFEKRSPLVLDLVMSGDNFWSKSPGRREGIHPKRGTEDIYIMEVVPSKGHSPPRLLEFVRNCSCFLSRGVGGA